MTQTLDFFRARLDAMIDLRHPLAVLATRLPWRELEAQLAPIWERQTREGVLRSAPEGDLLESGGGVVAANAGTRAAKSASQAASRG